MKLWIKIGFGPDHIVLDGDPAPFPQKGHSPQFSAHVCCGQMAGLIKMPLGMEVDLGPGHIVLDGDAAPPKGAEAPFSAHVYCGRTTSSAVDLLLLVSCINCILKNMFAVF